jgi:hypothetical protein
MTDEQIDRAIARHMGWQYLHKIEQIAFVHHGWCGINPESGYDEFIPDYCNDLNAMHEAEKTLSRLVLYHDIAGYGTYAKIIAATFGPNFNDVLMLTARQRAEAFLKTIGKWEEA